MEAKADKTKSSTTTGSIRTPAMGWFLRGLVMGMADMVPGISGGTMALITGIYPRLIAALAACNGTNLIRLFRGQVRIAWRAIDGSFLTVLLVGILSAVALMSHIVGRLFEAAPILLWGFFLGLLLLALGSMIRSVRWSAGALGVAAAGALVALVTVLGGSMTVTPTLPWLFMGGMVAITAMILPGISGSLLLLMLGLYAPAVEAVRALDVAALGALATGCATGILVFSRLLNWVLNQYENLAIAGMTGVVAGAMLRLWPWQSMSEGTAALQIAWPGTSLELGQGVLAIVAGMLVYALLSRARGSTAPV